jgi:alkanesulfonate monooxygenase SsuD/methylene tetrahydromethanopterin reductase-like flavin-dependent oxidoreductase (luciferase family)
MKVGAAVPLSHDPPVRYGALRELAQQVEARELDSLWVFDHLLFRRPNQPTAGGWEAWTVLTALADATQRVELGMLVAAVPFRNPAVFAKMLATLDEVSDGRVIAGLGAGWHQPEFDAFGIPFDHRVSRFEEAVHIIKPLLREGRVDFTGRFYQAPDCELIPRGPRPDGPRLLLAGVQPRMLDIVAQHADIWNTAWHGVPASARERLDAMRQACERNGRDPATLELTVGLAIAYPDLGGKTNFPVFLSDGVADALHGYAEMGVKHVIADVRPFTRAAIDRFAEAVARFRS